MHSKPLVREKIFPATTAGEVRSFFIFKKGQEKLIYTKSCVYWLLKLPKY
jgi:hypothetical protein